MNDTEQVKWGVALRMFEKSQASLYALRQQVEDTVLVAQTDQDGEGTIMAYHFKTGAIHRLLAKAREGQPQDNDSISIKSLRENLPINVVAQKVVNAVWRCVSRTEEGEIWLDNLKATKAVRQELKELCAIEEVTGKSEQ
jgi:hypothetical protein